jgi:hypothetical protein
VDYPGDESKAISAIQKRGIELIDYTKAGIRGK